MTKLATLATTLTVTLTVLLLGLVLATAPVGAAPQGFGPTNNGEPNTPHLDPRGFPQHGVQRAAPQGFGLETSKPNSVKGVKTHAKDGDFVLLEGMFSAVKKGNDQVFYLKDAQGDAIEVDITNSNNTTEPTSDVPYFLWGQVKTSWFNTSISAIEYTPML